MNKAHAIFLTHEHEDHFDVQTLKWLNDTIPIYISSFSSTAALTILKEMNKQLFLIDPEMPVKIGDLEFCGFQSDHLSMSQSDEWDTLSFSVFNGDGCFFSNVDVMPTPKAVKMVEAMAPQTLFYRYGKLELGSPQTLLQREKLRRRSRKNPMPLTAYEKALSAPLGSKIFLKNYKISAVQPSADLIRFRKGSPLKSKSTPLMRPFGFKPACGETEIAANELKEIRRELQRHAQAMYGTTYFRRAFSEPRMNTRGMLSNFAIQLRTGKKTPPLTFYYSPQDCKFVEAKTNNPEHSFIRGVRIWATDFLKILRGDFEVRILKEKNSSYYWDHTFHPKFEHIVHGEMFWPLFHPLQAPAKALQRYRSALTNATTHSASINSKP
jgi:hypothetical protein